MKNTSSSIVGREPASDRQLLHLNKCNIVGYLWMPTVLKLDFDIVQIVFSLCSLNPASRRLPWQLPNQITSSWDWNHDINRQLLKLYLDKVTGIIKHDFFSIWLNRGISAAQTHNLQCCFHTPAHATHVRQWRQSTAGYQTSKSSTNSQQLPPLQRTLPQSLSLSRILLHLIELNF